MNNLSIPSSWIQIELESCVEVLDSIRVPINNTERLQRIEGKTNDELYPYYGATGEVGKIDGYLFDEELIALGEDGVPFLDGAKSKAYMLRGKTWVNNHAHVLKSFDGITTNKFILNYLNKFNYQGYVNGGTRLKLTQANMRRIPVPLPSFAEQKQIAVKLDELLAQVVTIKNRLDTIPTMLKRFRQSVLAAAVSGKLTEKLRGTKSLALNQSPITIGKQTEYAPMGWEWIDLNDIATLESGHTPRKSKPEYWDDGDVYWISLRDIRAAHGTVINNTINKPTMLGIENSSARLLPAGTVCFSRDISVGFTTIMGKKMSTTQHFANWICGAELNNKYLMFSLMVAKDHLINSGQGTTVKTIYMPALKQFRLLTPPLKEQIEIVRLVEQLFSFSDLIEARVKDAQTRVNNLTQSILAKAFRGDLTAEWREQNPDLISGDNSAKALLEKIKVERESVTPKKRSSKIKA